MRDKKTAEKAESLAGELVKLLTEREESIALSESCTGGLAASYLCRISGASKVFWGSFVSYSIEAKNKMLEIPMESINKYNPVSREIALAMAEGAIKKSGVNWAFSITGLAGPVSDKDEGIPVGTVWIATANGNTASINSDAELYFFEDEGKPLSRNEIREAACAEAFKRIIKLIRDM